MSSRMRDSTSALQSKATETVRGMAHAGPSRFDRDIIDKTRGQLRTFLDELANGSSNYKSLHNLTAHLEHQYHDRFLIELIQNAHDALFDDPAAAGEQRVEVALVEDEGAHGALYVANDGQPFTRSNFEAICNLAQSDKDPEKHIGNKGIGFRSVLQISATPEIYSRSRPDAQGCDGYCFRFAPDWLQEVAGAVAELLGGNPRVSCPLNPGDPLVEWRQERLEEFCGRVRGRGPEFLREELLCLSPYALPLPVSREFPKALRDFERRGFATVVRLPLKGERAVETVVDELDALTMQSVVFLRRLGSLCTRRGRTQRVFRRLERPIRGDPLGGVEVVVEAAEPGAPSRRHIYRLWSRELGGPTDPEGACALEEAVRDLPGKWPEVRHALVALAVPWNGPREDGVLNIYLPTEVGSGCGAHLSGAFFGHMSRTHVPFGEPYNELLLDTLADLAVDLVLEAWVGGGTSEAKAVVDVLAPTSDEAGKRWAEAVRAAFKRRGEDMSSAKIFLTTLGWQAPDEAALLPLIPEPEVLSQEVLREVATFPVVELALYDRRDRVEALFATAGWESAPAGEWLADTVAAAADRLLQAGDDADWNGFWRDVMKLFPSSEPLQGKRVLLGQDGRLYAAGGEVPVFFPPRQARGDGEQGEGEEDEDEVSAEVARALPEGLTGRIALLSDKIKTHEKTEKKRWRLTKVQRYLADDLVRPFRVGDIVEELERLSPPLPVPHDAPEAALCRDLFEGTLRLVAGLVRKRKGDDVVLRLGWVPVPCRGGWYRLGDASFGPGWEGTAGAETLSYLEAAGTADAEEAARRLLLPPEDARWAGWGRESEGILRRAGVMDGLRLQAVKPDAWNSKLYLTVDRDVVLSEEKPPGIPSRMWAQYREVVRKTQKAKYVTVFAYEFRTFYAIPGFDRWDKLDNPARAAFTQALLASMSSWEEVQKVDWKNSIIKKMRGDRHALSVLSPLFFSLTHLDWLTVEQEEGVARFRPADRWLVPRRIAGRARYLYRHLRLVPEEISERIEADHVLLDQLRDLGMPVLDEGDERTDDPRLLEDLAAAWAERQGEIASRDVFVGQVRNAWSRFEPGDRFPEQWVVEVGRRNLGVVSPLRDAPVYMPDEAGPAYHALLTHEKPVVVIDPRDARRLKEAVKARLTREVRFASDFRLGARVDGAVWAREGDQCLADSDLDWLPPVVLSVLAYGGESGVGTGSDAFDQAIQTLRKIRFQWVDDLEAELQTVEGERVAATPVPALWLPDRKTLLAARTGPPEWRALSDALADALGRRTLGTALRLVLGRLDGVEDPADDEIVRALRELDISEGRYQEIRQYWVGNLGWTVRLVRPVVELLRPGASLVRLDDVNSHEALRKIVESLALPHVGTAELLDWVGEHRSFEALGRALHDRLGPKAELAQWNRALEAVGEAPVRNRAAREEFQAVVHESSVPLGAVLVQMLRAHPHERSFGELQDGLLRLEPLEEDTRSFWRLPFGRVMAVVGGYLRDLEAPEWLCRLIEGATTPEELGGRLREAGLDPDMDPVAFHARNRDRMRDSLRDIQTALIAWCGRTGVDPGPWVRPVPELLEGPFRTALAWEAFWERWDHAACVLLAAEVLASSGHEAFWRAAVASPDLEELRRELELTDEDFQKAEERIKAQRARLEEKRKIVKVAGREFVNVKDRLPELWRLVESEIPEDRLPALPLNQTETLGSFRRARGGASDSGVQGPRGTGSRKERLTQAMKDLLGVLGELHAYRLLQKTYPQAVGPACWVSENSRYFFPEKPTNDALGCDFQIKVKGRTYYVEVKATSGEDPVKDQAN